MKKGFERLGLMIDCSRNAVMNPQSVKRWIDLTADMGYNALLLYTEDTYEIEDRPYFGHFRGRYTADELREIDDYAAAHGMEVIPCIQTLAHLGAIMRWSCFGAFADDGDTLLAGDDRTYELIEEMFVSLKKSLRTRVINVGMDEAVGIGKGRYMDLHGVRDRFDILVEHLARVAQIAKKHGFEVTMWGDMFFRLAAGGNYYVDKVKIADAVRAKIPDNVSLIYWDYYSTDKKHYDRQIKAHNAVKDGVWFAGGIWTWTGFAPHNAFSLKATAAAVKSCVEHGVQNVFFTLWGDDGAECSKFATLPALFYAAEYAKGNTKLSDIKAKFKAKYGVAFDRFMLLDLPGTPNDVKNGVVNPDKYLFYNDCFMGVCDSTVRDGDAASYAACARKLALMKNDKTWGYLFRKMHALCEVLAIKADLGLRTRNAYQEGDRAALEAVAADYRKLLKKLDAFYRAWRDEWMIDNKPHGFDVQQQRIGGTMLRVRACAERLDAYLAGQTDRIEELEAPTLDLHCRPDLSKEPTCYNSWGSTVSVNRL